MTSNRLGELPRWKVATTLESLGFGAINANLAATSILRQKIIREHVYAFESGSNLALEVIVAELVAARTAPLVHDFAGFRPTIAMLMQLAETLARGCRRRYGPNRARRSLSVVGL
jgi:hypothetical protein